MHCNLAFSYRNERKEEMIKKITAFSLGVIMLVTLMSGCGKPANAKPEESLNLIFYSSADLSEYIKVSDYKNVKVDKAALDRLVNRELDKDFMLYTTDFPITDGEAMEGDLVNVTYTGYIAVSYTHLDVYKRQQ